MTKPTIDLNSLNSETINAMTTIEECDAAIEECTIALTSIKQQILKAKMLAAGHGQYSDPDWFARLNGAKGSRGAIHQKLIQRRAAIVREQREAEHAARERSFKDAFREVVRRNVDPATFARWTAEAAAMAPMY